MIYQERLFKIIQSIHVSEKTSVQSEKRNALAVTVAKYATKRDIKDAISMLFSVKVDNVNTIIISRRNKCRINNRGVRNTGKKAYIILEKGQKIDFMNIVD